MAKSPIEFKISAIDQVSAVISHIEKKLEGLSGVVARSNGMQKALAPIQKIGDTMTSVGNKMTLAVTLPVAGIAYASVKSAAAFESNMLRLQAATDAPESAMLSLQKEALKIGTTTQFSATQAAAAMVELGKAGFDDKSILASTKDVVSLAGAELIDLGEAASIVSDTMNQFGMVAKDTARITDVLTYAAGKSTTDVKGIAEALKYAGGAARLSGIEFEEVNAAVALLANLGMKGSMAGTALATGMEKLKVDPQGIAAMKAMGIQFDDLFSGVKDGKLQIKSLSSVLKVLDTKKANDRQLFDIFGQEAGRAFKLLLNQWQELDKMSNEMKTSANGFAKKQNDIKNAGLEGQLAKLKATLEVLMIGESGKDGAGLLGGATKGIQKLTGAVKVFSNLSPETKNFIYIFAGIAAAVGPVLIVLGFMASAIVKIAGAVALFWPILASIGGVFAVFISPIGAAVLAVTGAMIFLNYQVQKYFGGWGNLFSEIGDTLKTAFFAAFNWVKTMLSGFFHWVSSCFSASIVWIKGVFSGFFQWVSSGFRAVASTFSSVWQNITGVVSSVVQAVTSTVTGTISAIAALPGSVLDFFASLAEKIGAFLSPLSRYFGEIPDQFIEAYTVAFSEFTNTWKNEIQTIKDYWNAFTGWITGSLANLGDLFSGAFSGITGGIFGKTSLFSMETKTSAAPLMAPPALSSEIIAGQQSQAPGFGRVQVDFANMPRGVRVEQSKQNSMPLDLGLGYSMVTP